MSDSNHQTAEDPVAKKPRVTYSSMFTVLESSDDDDDDDADSDGASIRPSYELTLYQSIPAESDIDKSSLAFWKANEQTHPILSQIARRYLGIPATSVTVERLFSSAGNLITARRNALEPETANILNSLYCWLRNV
jgi:hypothetical protein